MKYWFTCILLLLILFTEKAQAQIFSIRGKVKNDATGEVIAFANVGLKGTENHAVTDEKGIYNLKNVKPGTYTLLVSLVGYKISSKEIIITNKDIERNFQLAASINKLDSVVIQGNKEKTFGITRLKAVEGTAIYAGKKSEVIVMEDVNANKATNNSRQVYSKIAGLNIFENDGAGIQLGIGGRGLNPNRVTNFNTRQNGYDMSADALGYPESYYSPPSEAINRIEILRGASSLQYGTQFGGLINFKMNEGPEDKKIEFISRNTGGSWNFLNTFNSVGGTVGKVQYYTFYQHKSGDGWRPNSDFDVNTAYSNIIYKVNSKLSISFQYTFMDYLAHQPGGLTDAEFNQDPSQSVRSRNWFKVNWNLGAVVVDYQISEHLKFNSRFFGLVASRSALGILTYIDRADPGGDRNLFVDNYRNWGNESRLLYTYNTHKNPYNLLVGIRYYNGHTDREQGLGNAGSGGTKSDFKFNNADALEYSGYTFPNYNTAIFAENIFRITSKLSIIPGIRFENILTKADGFYNIVNTDLAGNIIYNQRQNEHLSNNRSFVIGGIGGSYYQSEGVQLYANISQNYRAINFNDIRVINPNLQVDPNLKDEKGYSADLGTRGSVAGIFNYDLSLFMIYYANRIGTVLKSDTVTYNIYRYRTNISASRNLGLESFAEVDLWRLIRGKEAKMKLSVFTNFAYIDARYIHSQEPAYENKKVELAPNVIFKTGLSFKKGRFGAVYQVSYTSEQFTDASNAIFTSNAINGLIPAYYVMDLSAEYSFNKFFSLFGSINNLTDNMYFTRRADSYPGPGIIPADARSFS